MSKNIAIIGCGHWGKNLIRNFDNIGVLKGVFDSSPEQYLKSGIKDDIYKYQSLEEIGKDTDIDGVVIAVPPEYHYQVSDMFLDFGKHIFVEKPITLKIDDAKKLVDKAKSLGRVLMVGHILEYHPGIIKLREKIRNGDIGEIKEIYSHRLNTGTVRQVENVWWSFAPHDILLILNTVNSNVKDLTCIASDYMDRGVYDSTITAFKFENGVFAHIYVSWAHPFKYQNFIVVGTNGALEFNDTRTTEKLRIYNHKFTYSSEKHFDIIKGNYDVVDFDADEPLKQECLDFVNCIKTGSTPKSSGIDGLRVLEILEQATQKLK